MANRQVGKKTRKAGQGKTTAALIDFAFITAVEIEKEAICRIFKLTYKDRVPKGSRVYWRGKVPLKDGGHYEIVVAQPLDMAQVDAAILTNDVIRDWDPAALLMVGIAGAASDGQPLMVKP